VTEYVLGEAAVCVKVVVYVAFPVLVIVVDNESVGLLEGPLTVSSLEHVLLGVVVGVKVLVSVIVIVAVYARLVVGDAD